MLNYQVIRHSPGAPWVVFIHGAGGSIKTWSYQVEAFQKHFNLLLIDLRDHGDSKNINPSYEDYSFEVISQDIKTVLDHLEIDRAHFVTLSLGSVAVQDFAIRFGDTVDRIVMGGAIFKGSFSIRMFVTLARLMNRFLSYPSMYRLFSYLLMPKARHQAARRLYQLQARKLTRGEYLRWVGLYAEFFRLLKRFFRQVLDRPTLVIMGTEDYIFYPGARDYVRLQPRVSLATMNGVGHICNIEQPEAFNRLALDFLRG